jgi:hypothetical protein
MPKLKLPASRRPPGLYLYCPTHKNYYRDDSLKQCCDKVVYKAKIYVPGSQTVDNPESKGRYKTKILRTNDFFDALSLYTAFIKYLRETNYIDHIVKKNKITKPILLTDCIAWYLGYLNNEVTDELYEKTRERKVIRQYERSFENFINALKIGKCKEDDLAQPVDVVNLKFLDIDKRMIKYLRYYLKKIKKFRNKTTNNDMASVKSLFIHIVKNFYPAHVHPMVQWKSMKYKPKKDFISELEFYKTIEAISHENGYYMDGKKRLNCYRTWMADAFLMGYLTGGRNLEVVSGRWKDIHVDEEGNPSFILVPHFKTNRRDEHLYSEEEFEEKEVFIIPELLQLLVDLGYEKHRGSEKYIIAPEETIERDYLKRLMSRGFGHFFTVANSVYKPFRYLRKTFFTFITSKYPEVAPQILGDKFKTIKKHYFVNAQVAQDIQRILEARKKAEQAGKK